MPWDSDFGTALRTLRGQASPDAVGIPVSLPRARRVPGLRREELAGRAGVSAEHLKRMEQGRRRPSPTVVDALAAALRLTTTEHGRLRALAGFAAVPPTGGRVPQEITPAARRMLDRLDDVPVCVCDAAWTALEGNDRWAAFARPLAQASGRDRNLVWRTFAKEAPDGLRTTEHLTAFQASLVADLRDCIRTDLDCADVCAATAALLSRRTGSNLEVVKAQLTACRTACAACADDCEQHAEMHEHCKHCARACRRCEKACADLLAAIG